jgi:hypothetical protein
MALSASPKIRPIRVEGMNKRFYVAFANQRAFRDFKNNSTIVQALRDVSIATQNNKLFSGGDIEWDAVIVHECDDLPILSGVGAGSIDVGAVYLCGAQALGMAMAKRWTTKTEVFDYGDKHGVAIDAPS